MKKQYARPELSVYEMNLHQTMLCASITDSNGDAIGVDYYWDEVDDGSEAL